MRIVQWLAVAFAAAGTTAASTAGESLTPIKPWNVHYEPASCSALREYGDGANSIYLQLIPSVWGDTYALLIATKGLGPRYAEEMDGSVDFGNGPIKAWLMHYGVTKPVALNVYRFRISNAEMEQAKTAATATFRLAGRPSVKFSLQAFRSCLPRSRNARRIFATSGT